MGKCVGRRIDRIWKLDHFLKKIYIYILVIFCHIRFYTISHVPKIGKNLHVAIS